MGETERLQPELRTARLLLRRLRMADAHFIMTHAGDFQVARHLAVVPHPYPDGAAEAFITRCLAPHSDEQTWIIQYGDQDHAIPVGLISLRHEEPRTGLVGYWVAPWLWGFGFASEAVSCLAAHAARTGYACLKASVHDGNTASERVLEKSGFTRVGEGESHSEALKLTVPVGLFELRFPTGQGEPS
jgi:RimJ/RimL family protein N-acetyltransferase